MPNQVYHMSFLATSMLVIMLVLMTAIFLLAVVKLFRFVRSGRMQPTERDSDGGGQEENSVI